MSEPGPVSETVRAPAGSRQRHWLGLGLAGLILLGLAFWLDLHAVAARLGQLSPAALGGLVVLFVLDRVVMAWKWLLLLRVVDVDLPLWRVVRWYFQGTMSGAFMPSMVGGDLLRGYWAARASGRTAFVFASLVMEKMLGVLSALTWGFAGAVVFAVWRWPEGLWLWIGLGALAVLASNTLFVLSLRGEVHAWVLRLLGRGRQWRSLDLLHKLYEAYVPFSAARGPLALNLLITFGEHLLQMLILFAIARALGISPDPILFLAATAALTLILRVPVSPEGWGVGELTAIGLYGLIGIDAEAAFAIMFVSHLLVLIACAPGLLFLIQGEPALRPSR